MVKFSELLSIPLPKVHCFEAGLVLPVFESLSTLLPSLVTLFSRSPKLFLGPKGVNDSCFLLIVCVCVLWELALAHICILHPVHLPIHDSSCDDE